MTDNILVIGSGSLVGSRLVELMNKQGIEIQEAGSPFDAGLTGLNAFNELDITSKEQVESITNSFPGKYIINFAGLTAVDEIEKNKPKDPTNQQELAQNLTYKVNVLGTRNLIDACKKTGKFPILISTDFVFDGKNGPYSEEDPIASSPAAVGWYAWTKILAEREAIFGGIPYLMMRISYPYIKEYLPKIDFARNFLKLYDEIMANKRESFYPIFDDQILTPTFIDDLTPAVTTLIDKRASGIYHLASPMTTTPYNFCCQLLKVARNVANPEALVPKGSMVEFQKNHPELAKRPVKGGLKVDKIISCGYTPTSWREGIKRAFFLPAIAGVK
ncbi:sugar nucleotide-binding protein [Candidatus Microgenomates bacterium]|nr:sugar nucleotide-binding protein [Candidatus Microgenomates bacterium]